MPTPTYPSFYAFLMAKLEQYAKEGGIHPSTSENIEDNAYVFTILSNETQKWILAELATEESLLIIKNSNWRNNEEDKHFLECCNCKSYNDFFWGPFSESNLYTTASIWGNYEEIKEMLDLLHDHTFSLEKKYSQSNIIKDEIIVEESLDIEPTQDSFCRYLADTIKQQTRKKKNEAVSIQQIKDYILSLGDPKNEEKRVAFLRTLCDHYEDNQDKRPINRQNPSDILLLKSMQCTNFHFLLRDYLPLVGKDEGHNLTYSKIAQATPFLENIENRRPTGINAKLKTKSAPRSKPVAAKKDTPTSLAEVLKKLVSKHIPSGTRIGNNNQLIAALKVLNEEQKTTFLTDLRSLWRAEIQDAARYFNQENDTAFLKATGQTNYTFFLKDLFPAANPLDQFVFSQIGQYTPTLPSAPIKDRQNAAPNNTAEADKSLKNQGKAFFSKTVQKVGNRINDKRTDDERFSRFADNKETIKRAAKNFVFARIIGADVKEHISLKSTGTNCLWSGIKKIAGYMITPIKGALFVRKSVDDIFDYLEKKRYAEQYELFYKDITDEQCNKTIDNVLNRVETTMKGLLEKISDSDYSALTRYLMNKMGLAFDAINYSLLKTPQTEFAKEWRGFTPEQKQIQVEQMLFYMLFQPIRGVHKNEKIKVNGDSYRLEALMTLTPLKMPDGTLVYRQYREDKKPYVPTRLKDFYFDGKAYNDGMKGPKERELDAIANRAKREASSGFI